MLELEAPQDAYLATLDGRRKAHLMSTSGPIPNVGDHVAIVMQGSPNQRIFARVTYIEVCADISKLLIVLSLDVRLSTSRLQAVKVPERE
jgi:hypothetical protein